MTLVGAKTFIWPPMGQVRDSVHSLNKGDARVPNAIRLLRRAKPLCAKATPILVGARHRFETLAEHQRRQHSTGNAKNIFVMITIQSPDRRNTMTATIVITTKNRKEDLIRALDSCMRQKGIVETLVVDDGSTDGTSALVRSCFPSVRLVRFEESRGYIRARNEAARLAEGDVIISIDDDAEFSQPSIVETVLSEMEDPRVAAVAMPFIDVSLEKKLKQCAPDRNGTWITNEFIGTAHAIRKVVFREVGGYREVLFHQCEEGDFCIRLLERGWVVRLGNSAPITPLSLPVTQPGANERVWSTKLDALRVAQCSNAGIHRASNHDHVKRLALGTATRTVFPSVTRLVVRSPCQRTGAFLSASRDASHLLVLSPAEDLRLHTTTGRCSNRNATRGLKAKNTQWSVYIRNGLGRRLAVIGERTGQEWLVYNPLVMRQFHDEGMRNAQLVAAGDDGRLSPSTDTA